MEVVMKSIGIQGLDNDQGYIIAIIMNEPQFLIEEQLAELEIDFVITYRSDGKWYYYTGYL